MRNFMRGVWLLGEVQASETIMEQVGHAALPDTAT